MWPFLVSVVKNPAVRRVAIGLLLLVVDELVGRPRRTRRR
jgi:hypothetical protein